MEGHVSDYEKKNKGESFHDYMYRVLKKKIIHNHLVPGEVVSENALSSYFKVSRTPIRQAINNLSADELLEVYPQRGSYVTFIDMTRIEESMLMLELLESEAIKRSCRVMGDKEIFLLETNLSHQKICYAENQFEEVMDLDVEFHRLIFAGSNLLRVWQSIQGICSDIYRIRYLKLMSRIGWEENFEDYKRMIEDIKNKNIDKAIHDAKSHLKKIYDHAKIIQEKHPEYFK